MRSLFLEFCLEVDGDDGTPLKVSVRSGWIAGHGRREWKWKVQEYVADLDMFMNLTAESIN